MSTRKKIRTTKRAAANGEKARARRVTAMHHALEYIAGECRDLGLTETAELIAGSAYELVDEYDRLGKWKPKGEGVNAVSPYDVRLLRPRENPN